MSTYSTQAQITALIETVGAHPMSVCDMDGNVMIGFTFIGDTPCKLGPNDNPQVQTIPFGTPQRAITAMVEDGLYKRSIFADRRRWMFALRLSWSSCSTQSWKKPIPSLSLS